MKDFFQILEGTIAGLVFLGLFSLYLSGIHAYFEYGHWPVFGDPMYSKYSGTLFMYLFFSIFICLGGLIVQIIKLPMFLILKAQRKAYIQCLVYILLYSIYLLDPAGLLNWYID